MLKTATEIQAFWEPNIGDYYLWNGSLTVIGPTQFETATSFEIRDKAEWGNKNEYGQYIIGYFKEWVIMDFKTTTPFKCENIIKQFQEIYTSYKDAFWLPRQDQLQDMLDDVFSNREIVPLTAKLHDVCVHLIQKHNFRGRTMEQLWLAYIMHEKYGKTWNGQEWIR